MTNIKQPVFCKLLQSTWIQMHCLTELQQSFLTQDLVSIYNQKF